MTTYTYKQAAGLDIQLDVIRPDDVIAPPYDVVGADDIAAGR